MFRLSIQLLILFMGLPLLGPPAGIAKRTIDWKSYDEGMALSRQEGKKLFIHFYADW